MSNTAPIIAPQARKPNNLTGKKEMNPFVQRHISLVCDVESMEDLLLKSSNQLFITNNVLSVVYNSSCRRQFCLETRDNYNKALKRL